MDGESVALAVDMHVDRRDLQFQLVAHRGAKDCIAAIAAGAAICNIGDCVLLRFRRAVADVDADRAVAFVNRAGPRGGKHELEAIEGQLAEVPFCECDIRLAFRSAQSVTLLPSNCYPWCSVRVCD